MSSVPTTEAFQKSESSTAYGSDQIQVLIVLISLRVEFYMMSCVFLLVSALVFGLVNCFFKCGLEVACLAKGCLIHAGA